MPSGNVIRATSTRGPPSCSRSLPTWTWVAACQSASCWSQLALVRSKTPAAAARTCSSHHCRAASSPASLATTSGCCPGICTMSKTARVMTSIACRSGTLRRRVRGASTMSKVTRLHGWSSERPSGAAPGGCSVNGTIRLSFTPNTASRSRYGSPATKMCVTSGRKPGAVTLKCRCAGRIGPRPAALSRSPTGPSSGIGYGAGCTDQNRYRPSAPLRSQPRAAVRSSGYCTS